ncbi:MAG: SH3 domain-containing protein, partial [Bacteroidetes bacterium]
MLCFFAIVLLFTACRQNEPDSRIAEAVEAVRQELAPDRRVVWWQVEAVPHGKTVTLRGETSHPEAARLLAQKLEAAGYRVQDSLRLLPDSSVAGQVFGLVNLSVCNIRSRPKHSAELATQALLGTPLRVYQRQGDWWLVQTPDDYFGWLDADGFTPLTPEAFRQWQASPRL